MKLLLYFFRSCFLLGLMMSGAHLRAQTSNNPSGGIDSGGGNQYAQEVHGLAQSLARDFQNGVWPELAGTIQNQELNWIVNRFEVRVLGHLFLNGEEKTALNYPSASPPRIELNRYLWRELKGEDLQKKALVFHELLGLLRIADENYQVSSKILAHSDSNGASTCDESDDYQSRFVIGVWDFSAAYDVQSNPSLMMISKLPAGRILVTACLRKDFLENGVCRRPQLINDEPVKTTAFTMDYDAVQHNYTLLTSQSGYRLQVACDKSGVLYATMGSATVEGRRMEKKLP